MGGEVEGGEGSSVLNSSASLSTPRKWRTKTKEASERPLKADQRGDS